MNIIKPTAAFLAAASMATGVFAESSFMVQPTDFLTDTVTISGKIDCEEEQNINIVVSQEGVDPENITRAVDLFKQQNETKTDENGNFSFSFKMKSYDAEYDSTKRLWGEYGVYIKAGAADKPMYKILYSSKETDRKTAIAEINAGAQADILGKIDDYAKIFGLGDFEAMSAAKKSDIAYSLKQAEYAETDSQKVQNVMRESAILSCYNNKAFSTIADSRYNLKYTDLIGYDTFDKDYSTTLYECYCTLLSDSGKRLVLETTAESLPTDYDSLKRAFAKSVVLCGIKNAAQSGGEHIGKLLTEDNAKLVGLSATGYFASDMKNKIHSELLKESDFSSIADLEAKLKKIIAALPKKETGGGNSSTGKTSFSGPSSSMAAEINKEEKEIIFSDMGEEHWARIACEELYKTGTLNGYPDGTFRPEGRVTREQAVKMILGTGKYEPCEYKGNFVDVDKNAWYAGFLGTGLQNGIVKGISGNLFGIGKNVTREDFAVMLYRAIGSPESEGAPDFADGAEISSYAVRAVDYMKSKQIISGYSDGTFRPEKTITRAEAAMILYKLAGGENR